LHAITLLTYYLCKENAQASSFVCNQVMRINRVSILYFMAKKINPKIIRQVTIGNPTDEGKCLAYCEGQVIFVEQVAPGDIADIMLTKQKKGYAEAVLHYLHKPSPSRATPFCQHFGVCGGCQWQHIDYLSQLQAKEQLVKEKLMHIGKLSNPPVAPIIAAKTTQYYRNKLEFTFSTKRWLTASEIQSAALLDRNALGFHKAKFFDKIVAIDHCYLQPDPSNPIRLAIKEFAQAQGFSFYDFQQQQGLLRNLIIRTTSTHEVMVIVQFGEPNQAQINQMMAHIQHQFPTLTSLQYVVNTKPNETFYDLPVHCYTGKPYILEKIGDLQWQIGPKSFFQTNTTQAQVLFEHILDLANLQGHELVYDLYTGVGSIAHFLATKAKYVVGLELIAGAIEDAKTNARLNQLANVSFQVGDIRSLLNEQLVATYGQPDLIVVDPPRAGMHPEVIKQLLAIAPEKIIYVSCNPATQARDIVCLKEHYQLQKAQPIDLFPHTHHIENIALLVKN
jgi:23S rRNA (uracil1939-C5)-methyltransferase